MQQLREMPDRVARILKTLRSLREDLFDDNIGFIRHKVRQILHNESEGSPSNLNNYLIAVQRIADNCQSYWQRKGRTQEGYGSLLQQLSDLKGAMDPIIAAHREQPAEIRKAIKYVKTQLQLFLNSFVSHEQEDRQKKSKSPAGRVKKLPSSQKTSHKPTGKKGGHIGPHPKSLSINRPPQKLNPLEQALDKIAEERKNDRKEA